jgi:hypothetical protein
MKFVDVTSLFETEPATLAVLSTFQFDPDFFERRLLRCPALAKARRIAVFMDAGQWYNLIRQDAPARLLNRRYLVIRVRPPRGVFHPKLNLLVSEDEGQVQCGSNNLTRAGCSSNLELLNCVRFDPNGDDQGSLRLAREAYTFFVRACLDAEGQVGHVALRWLEEMSADAPWITAPSAPNHGQTVRLLHTYDGSLWDRVENLLAGSPPLKVLIVSPFYDPDAEMVRRLCRRWPECDVELVVQQQRTTLPVPAVKGLQARVKLSELRNSSRRLHAKVVCWKTARGTGCLVGSANFTTAAFDARNVEACLLLPEAEHLVRRLFDTDLGKKSISFEDFAPGTEREPEEDAAPTDLRVTSAILTETDELRVGYSHRLTPKPDCLRLGIRTPGEQRPRALFSVPNMENGTDTVVPEASTLKNAHGTILAFLIAESGGHRRESPPVWVVQEARLTYEPGGEGSSSAKAKVEETGEGLAEFLEELGKREGVSAVVEYLRHLNIRFHDGGDGFRVGRKFRLRIRDPFHPDVAPEWLLGADAEQDDLTAAILDFVDRHEKVRLNRHAKRGNINGMENFLDILTALIRLLYVYHIRGRVHRGMLVGRVCQYLQTATCGIDTDEAFSEGYLYSVHDNLGDSDYLREVCDELNFLGHLRAALLIAQKVRYTPGEKAVQWTPPQRPSECLPHIRKMLASAVAKVGLSMPTRPRIMTALREYNVFSPDELAALEKEIASEKV